MELDLSERHFLSKSVLSPESLRYKEIKQACLNGDYYVHFLERDFSSFDKASKIFLYEYNDWDYDHLQEVYNSIKEDKSLFEYNEIIVLFDVSNIKERESVPVFDIMNKISELNFEPRWGFRHATKIMFLCC